MPSQYLTVAELVNAPLGLSLRSVPPLGATGPTGVTGQQTYAELMNVVLRASALMDTYCRQVLGATVDSEEKWTGSGLAGVDANGYLWAHTDYWPVLSVSALQYGYAAVGGTSWTAAALTDLIVFRERIVYPGAFAQRGVPPLRVQYTYVNGWPNTVLTAAASAGGTAIAVAEATGIIAGAKLTIYDGGGTEQVTVASGWLPATGPALVPLSAPLQFAHTPIFRPAAPPSQPYDISVSALPADIKAAALLICKALIETRGANALVMGRVGSVRGSAMPNPAAMENVPPEAQATLNHYRRVL